MNSSDLKTLYATATELIKLSPKYLSRKKLHILIYFTNVEHLKLYGSFITPTTVIYAGKDHPIIKNLDHVLSPGWFTPRYKEHL